MSDERAEIITSARELQADFAANVSGPGRFEREQDRELAAALDVIAGHGQADDQIRTFDGHAAQIGSYVLYTNDQGFVTFEKFNTADAASLHVDELAEDFDRGGDE